MKKYLDKIKNIIELSPALAVALAALLGFQLTTPVLNDIVWPEKQEIQVEAKAKKNKQGKKEETKKKASAVGNYKDGVFSGVGVGYGGPMTVQVTVAGGQITTIEVLDNNETDNFLNLAKRGVIDAIIDGQTWEVDSVSGATYSSRGIKEGVCNAITGQASTSSAPEQAGPKGAPPANSSFKLGEWADGSYEGTSHGFGGPIKVRVTIKNGKIKSIKVLSHSGETASYYNKAKSVINRILSAQSPNVDTVSGATYSSGGIREAVKNALKKAGGSKSSRKDKKKTGTKKNNKKTSPNPEVKVPKGSPADGTYTGTASCRQDGRFNYSITVTATYKDGKLVDLSMTTTDKGSNQRYIDRAWPALKSSLLSNSSGDVDVISSATYTSNAIKTAYKLAYKAAVEANGGSLDESPESEEDSEPKEDSKPEGNLGSGSGSQSGEANLSGIPADGDYPVTVTVNSYDAIKDSEDGWFSDYHLSGTVTFADGKLTSITKILVEEDAEEYELEDDDYYTSMASRKMVNRLIEKQSNDVDIVTGATCSSKGIIALYEEAFRQAVKDYKEPLPDEKENGEDKPKHDSSAKDKEEIKPDSSEKDKEEAKPDSSEQDKEETKQDKDASETEAEEEEMTAGNEEESKQDAAMPEKKEIKQDTAASDKKETKQDASASKKKGENSDKKSEKSNETDAREPAKEEKPKESKDESPKEDEEKDRGEMS